MARLRRSSSSRGVKSVSGSMMRKTPSVGSLGSATKGRMMSFVLSHGCQGHLTHDSLIGLRRWTVSMVVRACVYFPAGPLAHKLMGPCFSVSGVPARRPPVSKTLYYTGPASSHHTTPAPHSPRGAHVAHIEH